MNKRTIIILFMAFIILPITLFACKKNETVPAKQSPELHQQEMLTRSFAESKKVIAAKVNNEPITEFSVLREMNTLAAQYVNRGKDPKPGPGLDKKIRTDALNILIFQTLAVQEARKLGMTVRQEDVDGEINKIKTAKGSAGAFQAYLDANGLTEDELRKMIEQDYLFEQIATREIDEKITVTEADLRARFKKYKALLKGSAHEQMTFEEAKGQLEQKVREEAAEKRMREWEKELRKNARIEIIEQMPKQG